MRRSQLESLIVPVILLLTGLILIGGDSAGVLSLDRIQNLWPTALILIGLSELLTTTDDEPGSELTSSRGAHDGARRV